ncbi:MAG: hypothetical protein M3370_05810 [Actinomycetota bacterium]|nr:hypothetical protein [Actinomycetota bacterium]
MDHEKNAQRADQRVQDAADRARHARDQERGARSRADRAQDDAAAQAHRREAEHAACAAELHDAATELQRTHAAHEREAHERQGRRG